jgi:hypothetical protein
MDDRRLIRFDCIDFSPTLIGGYTQLLRTGRIIEGVVTRKFMGENGPPVDTILPFLVSCPACPRSFTMSSLSLRSMALRRLLYHSSANKEALRAGSSWISAGSLRSVSTHVTPLTEEELAFQAKGYLDERGLTVFDTLHEMQVRSCKVFAPKDLFGTYSDESKKFEWMTFQDYEQAVDKCRAVLKDLGTSCRVASTERRLIISFISY